MSQSSKKGPPGRSYSSWGLPAVLVAGMVIAAVAGFWFVSQVLMAPSSPQLSNEPDPKAMGAIDAPVTVVEYGDFQ